MRAPPRSSHQVLLFTIAASASHSIAAFTTGAGITTTAFNTAFSVVVPPSFNRNTFLAQSIEIESTAALLRNSEHHPKVLNPTTQGAQELVQQEPLLGGFVYSNILNQPTFERALAFSLASKLATDTIQQTQWNDLVIDAIMSTAAEEVAESSSSAEAGISGGSGDATGSATVNDSGGGSIPGIGSIADAARADLKAIKSRDPACPSYTHAFLFFKGFQGLQAQRVSHWLWSKGRTVIASSVQSIISAGPNLSLNSSF